MERIFAWRAKAYAKVWSIGRRALAARNVTSLADKIVRPILMRDTLDVLLDDRTFIEVGGDVVRRGPDQFDAAAMGLVIRPRTLESGKKGVVDIDAASRELGREIVGQDLHVAGKDDEIDLPRFNDLPDCIFLLRPGFRRDRQMVEGNTGQVMMPIGFLRMIGNHAGDVDRKFTDPPAVQEVGEAVIEARDQHQHALALGARANLPLHAVAVGDRTERPAKGFDLAAIDEIEPDTGKKQVRLDVIVLVRFLDVAAAFEQSACDRGDDAGAVGA